MSERGRLSTQAGVSSSRERAQEKSRQSGVQLSSFSLSFDFFVSSSARVPVNVYDNLPVIAELPKGTVISCVTSFGSEPDYFVHVGTSEGAVLLYRVSKRKTQSNTDCFESSMAKKVILVKQKKDHIKQLAVLHEGVRIVALTGSGVVQIMDATTLDIEETLASKNVDRVVTERLSPLMGIALVQKKVVQIFQRRGGEYKLEKEVTLKDVPEDLEWTKGKLFIAYKNRYSFIYVDTESVEETEIEGLDPAGTPTLIQAGEVMIMGAGRQGTFATFTGKKTGKKLDWAAPPVNVVYRKPYAISLQKEQVEIHNCSDESMVQIIKNTQQMESLSDGALVLGASQSLVFCLHARSWDSQIGQLVKAQRVEEAVNLFKTSIPASTAPSEKERVLREIHKAAGVVLFSNLKFSAAVQPLKDSDVDLLELVSLFPGYLPSSVNYKPRHQVGSIESLITETLLKRTKSHSAPTDRVKQYEKAARECVLEILMHKRDGECKAKKGSEAHTLRKVIDTAIIKLLVDLDSPQLGTFLGSQIPILAEDDDIVQYLTETNHQSGLAMWHRVHGDLVKALELWRDVGKEAIASLEATDAASVSQVVGLKDTVDLLSQSSDLKLIFKYSSWVLESNLAVGASIFTSTRRKEPLPVDEVFNYLSAIKKFGAEVASKYLEFVVYQQKNSDEKYHTKLANAYLDVILPMLPESYEKDQPRPEPGTEPGLLGKFRLMLLKLMEFSKVLNASVLLLRIKDTVLFEEQVSCYSALGQHEDALRVIFTSLKSHNKATAYCAKNQASADVNLFLILLKVCFLFVLLFMCFSNRKKKVYLKRVKNGELPQKAVNLLNDYPQYLRPNEVIPLLPPTISIGKLESYFERSLRELQSSLRRGQVEKQLRKKDLLDAQLTRAQLTGRRVVIQPNTKCKVCKAAIGETMMVYYPNGVICHFKCKKSDYICPVTGHDFRKDSVQQ